MLPTSPPLSAQHTGSPRLATSLTSLPLGAQLLVAPWISAYPAVDSHLSAWVSEAPNFSNSSLPLHAQLTVSQQLSEAHNFSDSFSTPRCTAPWLCAYPAPSAEASPPQCVGSYFSDCPAS